VALGIATCCFPSVAPAAQTEVARLGLLSDYEKFGGSASPSDWLAAFRTGLRDLGYIEGKNVLLEARYANRDSEKLACMAAELAAMKVDIIVAASTTAAKAAKAATHTIPIVFWGAEPPSSGLVANLDHPCENLTGVTFNEEAQKEFLAQLKEVLPGLNRVAILFNRSYAPALGILKYAESGARELGLSPQVVEVATPGDLPGAFAAMKRGGSRAVLVLNHRMFFEDRATLATLAITNGIAVSTPYLPSAEAGALIAHEADFDQVWRINAGYVDKILKGANPGDLPVQRLAAFRHAVNLKTANALGLTVPGPILKGALVIPDSAKREASYTQRIETNQKQPPSPKESDTGPAAQAVLARTDELNQAFLSADMAALDRIIADDCLQITQNGAGTKAEWLAPYRNGTRRLESIAPPEWRRIRLYGDVAVVTSAGQIVVLVQGERRTYRLFSTRTWVKRSGQWYLVLAQNTPRAEQGAAQPQASSSDCNQAAPKPLQTVDLPGHPFSIASTRDGCWLFVSLTSEDPKANGVAVLRRAGGNITLERVYPIEARKGRNPMRPGPSGMVMTHDGQLLIAANDDEVIFLDVQSMISGKADSVVGRLSDGTPRHTVSTSNGWTENSAGSLYVNVTKDDARLFVSDEYAETISVVDLKKARASKYDPGAIVGQIPVGVAPIALTFSPDERWLYTTSHDASPSWNWPVACPQDRADRAVFTKLEKPEGAVVVVDVPRARTDPAHSVVAKVPAGCGSVRLAIAPDGGSIWVSARRGDTVLGFDTRQLLNDPLHARLGSVPVGTAPVGIAALPDGKHVVVANSNRIAANPNSPQTVSVIDIARVRDGAPAVIGTFPAGAFPREFSQSPDGRTLFLGNYLSNTLEVIDEERLPVVAKSASQPHLEVP
jgi:ABC-type uncharacterized transport system substrate-binding protein/DNA-binding beta-propeller fold protein YncE